MAKARAKPQREPQPPAKNAEGGQELPAESKTADDGQTAKPLTPNEVYESIRVSFEPGAGSDLETGRDELLRRYLREQYDLYPISKQYNVLVLYDEHLMVKSDADRIYSGTRSFTEEKPLLLVLHSNGGDVGSAYLIGKLCREYSHGKLVVVVPRRAKSAATLICCAADEIHMGSLSELGPIDPQIDGLPALGLKSSI